MPLEMGKRMRAWGIGGRRKHKECYNCTVCRARCVWVLLTVTSAVALRFVMAMPSEFEGVKHREALVERAHEEHARHGDIAILNATESFFTCPLKYLLWLRVAPSLFPSARWVTLADDDAYLQLDHLGAELARVEALTDATREPVLWGLITWKIYVNNISFDTSTGFSGWSYYDEAAVTRRRQVERCQAAYGTKPNASANECRRLSTKQRAHLTKGAIGSTPPWPMANGPLFALSLPLAKLVSNDSIPPLMRDRQH